jgi:hypothetical protein
MKASSSARDKASGGRPVAIGKGCELRQIAGIAFHGVGRQAPLHGQVREVRVDRR